METSQIAKTRGRSRLKSAPTASPIVPKVRKIPQHSLAWPKLLIALALWSGLLCLTNCFPPTALENILITHSYWPVIVLICLASYFSLQFFSLEKNLSWTLAFTLSLLVFLKLQILTFNYYWLIILTVAPISYLVWRLNCYNKSL